MHYRYENCTLPLRVFRRTIRLAGMSQAEAGRFRYSFSKEPSELVLTVKRGADLAELIGICLGDGNLEPNTLAIFGDKSTDTAYLVDHVAPLMRRTLKLTARLKKNRPD